MADTHRSSESPDEETPLLQVKNDAKSSSPLPKLQLSILLLMLLSEPVSFSSISPYISRVSLVPLSFSFTISDTSCYKLISGMEITHGDESQVGYYIGLMVRGMHCVRGRCSLILL